MIEFTDTGDKVIKLKGKLTIYKCSELKKHLLTAWDGAEKKSGKWVIDVSAIEATDLAIVQVLLALRNQVTANGGTMVLRSPAAAVREIIELFSLQKEFVEEN